MWTAKFKVGAKIRHKTIGNPRLWTIIKIDQDHLHVQSFHPERGETEPTERTLSSLDDFENL